MFLCSLPIYGKLDLCVAFLIARKFVLFLLRAIVRERNFNYYFIILRPSSILFCVNMRIFEWDYTLLMVNVKVYTRSPVFLFRTRSNVFMSYKWISFIVCHLCMETNTWIDERKYMINDSENEAHHWILRKRLKTTPFNTYILNYKCRSFCHLIPKWQLDEDDFDLRYNLIFISYKIACTNTSKQIDYTLILISPANSVQSHMCGWKL